jgi:hypothetical protein
MWVMVLEYSVSQLENKPSLKRNDSLKQVIYEQFLLLNGVVKPYTKKVVELSSRKNLSKYLDAVLHILALHETLRSRKIIYTLNKDPVRTSERTPYVSVKIFKAVFLHTFRVYIHKNFTKDSNSYELLPVT